LANVYIHLETKRSLRVYETDPQKTILKDERQG